MNIQEETLYDVFVAELAERPLWLVAVNGLSRAVTVMRRIASKHPGRYFVLDEKGGMVAQTDRPQAKLSASAGSSAA